MVQGSRCRLPTCLACTLLQEGCRNPAGRLGSWHSGLFLPITWFTRRLVAAWLGVCVGVEVGAPRWHALTPPASQLTEIYCSFALCRVSVSSKSPPQISNRIWLHASRYCGDNKRLMGAGSRAGAASGQGSMLQRHPSASENSVKPTQNPA